MDQITFTSEAFYNSDEVKKALHAPANITWHGCRPGGGRRRLKEKRMSSRTPEERRKLLYMIDDRPIAVTPFIEDLLNSDVPVLVYNGDRDMTTNMVGQELALNQMRNWKKFDKWLDAPRGLWMDSNSGSKHPEAGWAKEYGSLSFVVVYNSGHMVSRLKITRKQATTMQWKVDIVLTLLHFLDNNQIQVPYNVPSPALDLVTRFISGKKFIDVETPGYRYNPDKKSKFKHSGVEKWMNTGPFPHVHHKYYDSIANFPGYNLEQVLEPNVNLNGSATSSSLLGTGVAFLAGMVVTLLVTKLVARNNRSQQEGYQQVPNATLQ